MRHAQQHGQQPREATARGSAGTPPAVDQDQAAGHAGDSRGGDCRRPEGGHVQHQRLGTAHQQVQAGWVSTFQQTALGFPVHKLRRDCSPRSEQPEVERGEGGQ